MSISRIVPVLCLTVPCLTAGACSTNAPQYIDPQEALEVGIPDPAVPDGVIAEATTQIVLPIRPETQTEAAQRALLAMQLGVAVPIVTVEDISVSIEWSIKNLSDQDGVARIRLDGGNESFVYVAENFVIDPEEDEEPPSLVGGVPIEVPAGGIRSGVLREDQIREGAVDLELMTQAGYNPFAAILEHNGDIDEIELPDGTILPEQAFAQMVQLDIRFAADQHMVLEYDVRVRDHQGILHELLLDAPAGELIPFAPVEFVPPPPPVAMGQ